MDYGGLRWTTVDYGGLRDGGLGSMPNNVLRGLKRYDTGMQLNDNLYIPTLIREYYNKMKQTVHHDHRELLMKLGVIIWLHVIYCMSGGNFLI